MPNLPGTVPCRYSTLSKCDESKRCLQTAESDRRFIGVVSESVQLKHKFYSRSEIYNILHLEIFFVAFISPLWPSATTAVWKCFLLSSLGNVCDVRILCGMDTPCSSQSCEQKHSCSSDCKGDSDQFFWAVLHLHVLVIQSWVHQTNQYTIDGKFPVVYTVSQLIHVWLKKSILRRHISCRETSK